MKKIGFIDYYISEWHANNYPEWIKAANEALGTDYEVAYVWAEIDVSPIDGVTTDQWCEKFGATRCATVDELCEKSDVIMILSPSFPEKHLPYAKAALPYKKRTYIDKSFAPNLETAKEIFAIAEKYGTPFFSTSALRYASELEDIKDARKVAFTGGGRSFEEYCIHTIEMAVILLNDPVKEAVAGELDGHLFCRAFTENGKEVSITYDPTFTFSVDDGSGVKSISSDFFATLLKKILEFYESGKLPFDGAQTLEVMRMRDCLLAACACKGTTVEAKLK